MYEYDRTLALPPPKTSKALPWGTRVGAYRLEAKIGQGGFGEVYLARHLALQRFAAIKLMHPYLANGTGPARFINEAQILHRVRHPNVIDIFDFGQRDDRCFLVMELLEGEDLAARIHREGALPVDETYRIAAAICAGLEAAHNLHVIHRDLKDSNIFLCRDGTVKVLDFGVAKLLDEQQPQTTSTITGSPGTMAPEQIMGRPISFATDVYALGAVLHLMLTGRPIFVANSRAEAFRKHLIDQPIPPSSWFRHLAPFDVVVAKCLHKIPNQRYNSVTEVLAALQAAARWY